ncbi:MAG: hypothetical protein KDA85_19445, partial [Planctomycetaceae bacterium]|nr:hypothetical protein [Planctomycetaceae bacterium]
MPNAIRSDSDRHRTTGVATPGLYDQRPGTPQQQVHDGDTLSVRLNGNVGVRLLGIDTPEISFVLPGASPRFVGLDDPQWAAFLTDPLNEQWGPMIALPELLKHWLAARIGPGAAAAHYQHAVLARDDLQRMIARDLTEMKQTPEEFGYYMNFGFEVMDGYGRLLCIINRDQPDANLPTPRPRSYNLRLLEAGRAFPYLIWPNINPWERPGSVVDAVIPPGAARQLAIQDSELRTVRAAVRFARDSHRGIFDAMSPALLEPFELRYLSRRSGPERALIDLNADSDQLIHPLNYPSVPNAEDRLWIPAQYIPLFEAHGW